MQTFMVYPNYQRSAAVLDDKRLGKQRVEGLQIINALMGITEGWLNHPATQMWKGHVPDLCNYVVACCNEWISRGFKDTVAGKVTELKKRAGVWKQVPWLGDERLHSSHRANLLRKDFDYYRKFGWSEAELPNYNLIAYYWPKLKDYEMPGFLKTNRTYSPQEKWTVIIRINVINEGLIPQTAEHKFNETFASEADAAEFVFKNVKYNSGRVFAYSPDGEEYVWRT